MSPKYRDPSFHLALRFDPPKILFSFRKIFLPTPPFHCLLSVNSMNEQKKNLGDLSVTLRLLKDLDNKNLSN